jgi:hypothetical protein
MQTQDVAEVKKGYARYCKNGNKWNLSIRREHG